MTSSCNPVPARTTSAQPSLTTSSQPTPVSTAIILPIATSTITYTLLALQKGPYLILTGDPATLKICWQFVQPAPATLEWGTDETFALGSIDVVAASALDDLSTATLTGLLPATHYFYRLRNGSTAFTSSFTTAPAADATDLTFWAYGDTQTSPAVHDALDQAILAEIGQAPSNQTLVADLGDLMDDPTEENLQQNEFDPQWVDSTRLRSEVPFVNIMGNHDGTKLFLKYFPYLYTPTFDWSFDYGPAHFVIIDLYSNTSADSSRWLWLKNDLANSNKKWKFILLHEPGWSAGPHENNLVVQKIIHPLAVRYRVSVVFSGHNHYYARAQMDGVTYITSGGGGGTLYDPEYYWTNIVVKKKDHHYLRVVITGSDLTITALTTQGEVLDNFVLTK
jgi:predicted phosphodiesterase